ncbi:hypothetical protein VY88_32260 [Azospirillum thiophilum]|uniref:HTH araC/xylS-type domain-containing protein n=1 Tax=Azospirillum thiophilum TaxID=528244 RepID=A0AAC9EXQ9_9PROT|nr:AraC family transcriptional regulator [Azospirillum thiophilum]ALG72412.1 hypothetical protein AL072_14975 [Azospirillum thiophilum]KJR61373.1 hypothetical protein VY88_32260 [Azospirillum thiophilum]
MAAIWPGADAPALDGLDGAALRSAATGGDDHFARGAHRHPHGEFFLLRSGYMRSQSPTGRWLIPAGHLCWVPPFTDHAGDTANTDGVRLYLAPEFCQGFPDEPAVMRCTPLVGALVERLAAARLHPVISGATGRLLAVLQDELIEARGGLMMLPMPQDSRLRGAVETWMDRPDEQVGLDEIAAAAGMSRRSLTRKFRLDTGLPVGEWLQIAKLMHGIDLLAAGRSVTDTAFMLGYDSISSFVALCQRHTGMSPKVLARTLTAGK